MKKLFLIGLTVVVLVGMGILVAAAQEKTMLSIGTHPVGTTFNVIGSAIAKLVSDHTKYKMTVKAMAGPSAWFPYMERGEVDFGVLNVWDAEMGYKGEYEYKELSKGKGFDIRLVAFTVPNKISAVTSKDSGITTLSQLKGKRLACRYPTPSLHLQALAMLANGGLTIDDVIVIPVTSITEGVNAVITGRADATGTVTLGTPILQELEARRGARFLPIDPSPEAVKRARQFFPGYPVLVKAGPIGVETDRYLWCYDVYVICSAALPDKVVYEVVRVMYENIAELQRFHKQLEEWTQKGLVRADFSIPFHPGAVAFYKGVGLWTAEMDALNQKLLSSRSR